MWGHRELRTVAGARQRERHIRSARTDNLPYPQRAIRTKDFLYIRNFSPERWPMGTSLGYGRSNGSLPDYEQLRDNTFSAFSDMDASPTKAWIAHNCRTPGLQKYFDVAFGRRPAEELYDMRTDPDQVTSLADNPAYDSARIELAGRLMEVLVATGDPRVTGTGRTYDQAPFARESDP